MSTSGGALWEDTNSLSNGTMRGSRNDVPTVETANAGRVGKGVPQARYAG